MYDKVMYEKIMKVECTYEEIMNFSCHISTTELDKENAFEKYYELSKLLLAIEKYQTGQISDKYLAYWMTAYNWIIMGAFENCEDDSLSFKELLIWLISDWIDSLSFFEKDFKAEYNLDEYITAFTTLTKLYEESHDCKVAFAPYGCNEDNVVILAINEKEKYFARIYSEFEYLELKHNFEHVDCDEIIQREEMLSATNYIKLPYPYSNDDLNED